MKDGKIRLPDEVLQNMELQPGDTLHLETNAKGKVILSKSKTTYVTVEIPTTVYDQAHRIMKEHEYDTTVDQFINDAVTKLLNDFNN